MKIGKNRFQCFVPKKCGVCFDKGYAIDGMKAVQSMESNYCSPIGYFSIYTI
jgi:hypothetical protein